MIVFSRVIDVYQAKVSQEVIKRFGIGGKCLVTTTTKTNCVASFFNKVPPSVITGL